MKTKNYIFIIVLLTSLASISASHFIIGRVNNALDSTPANDHTAILWNPLNGVSDNLTDIIGINGNSHQNNLYMIDCELLNPPCTIGDQLKIKVQNNGDDYVSETTTAIVTGAGYDLAPDLTLNSPPQTFLNSPASEENFSSQVTFNCSGEDPDSNLANITLYGNWTIGWQANETKDLTGSSNSSLFTKTLPEGKYKYSCLVTDNLSISTFAAQNNTFNVDLTPPQINSIYVNESYACGTTQYLRVNCTTTDSFTGISTVLIEAIKPSGKENFTTQPITQDTFYADIPLNELGEWQFNCIANDTAGNYQNLTSQKITSYSSNAEISIFPNSIIFLPQDPKENEETIIEVLVSNNGCQQATNILVGFFENNPLAGGIQINENKTITIFQRSNETANITWNAKIGPTNIFVFADIGQTISESNETDNIKNQTIEVGAWQEYYGLLNSTRILGDFSLNNLSVWFNESTSTGNIFVVDKESIIDWSALQAIGQDTSDSQTSNDFSNIDSNLGMTQYDDSVSNKFTTDGNTPIKTDNFIIHSQTISKVPIINSTNSANFSTGILWDTSYDTNSEYDTIDNEKLVFVTKINKNSTGSFGTYDYEITIPVKLREQDPTDSSEVYFYYELI